MKLRVALPLLVGAAYFAGWTALHPPNYPPKSAKVVPVEVADFCPKSIPATISRVWMGSVVQYQVMVKLTNDTQEVIRFQPIQGVFSNLTGSVSVLAPGLVGAPDAQSNSSFTLPPGGTVSLYFRSGRGTQSLLATPNGELGFSLCLNGGSYEISLPDLNAWPTKAPLVIPVMLVASTSQSSI